MLLDGLTGWILFAGLLLAIGSVVGHWIILPRAIPPSDEARARLQRASGAPALGGAALIASGLALYLVRQLREFRDPFVPLSEDVSLLMSTDWGASWKAAAVGSVLLVGSAAVARSGRAAGWWLATPVALALAMFPGLTGHAGGADNRTLALALDGLHVWAAGAWMGGLAFVLYLEARRGREASLLPSLVPAFSPVAMAAVGTLVVTGVYASWTQLENVGALFTTAYGRTLGLKLLLVGVVLAFGARNFKVLTPRLGTDAGDAAMRRSAALELAVAQLVLLVTAVLVRTSPTGH